MPQMLGGLPPGAPFLGRWCGTGDMRQRCGHVFQRSDVNVVEHRRKATQPDWRCDDTQTMREIVGDFDVGAASGSHGIEADMARLQEIGEVAVFQLVVEANVARRMNAIQGATDTTYNMKGDIAQTWGQRLHDKARGGDIGRPVAAHENDRTGHSLSECGPEIRIVRKPRLRPIRQRNEGVWDNAAQCHQLGLIIRGGDRDMICDPAKPVFELSNQRKVIMAWTFI